VITEFSIGVHNTQHGAATFKPFADLIAWSEVDTPTASRRLHRAMRSAGWGTIGLEHEIPISFRTRDWHLGKWDVERVHGGLAHVSPARFITWASLTHKTTDQKVRMIGTHMVSGAFNQNTHEKGEKWRRDMWDRHYQRLNDLCHLWAGETLILAGDLNRQRGFTFHGLERADPGSVDHIWIDTTAEVIEHQQLGRNGSDHPAERVKVRIP
jgi:hypothetical protein